MKLLVKTGYTFALYATLLFLIAVPLFYFVIKGIVVEEVDESLRARKSQFSANNAVPAGHITGNLSVTQGYELKPASGLNIPDTIYSFTKYDSASEENIPYRTLKSNITVAGRNYALSLYSSMLDSEDLIEAIVLAMAVLLLAILLGLLIINRQVSKKTWKPFYKTLNELKNYSMEDGRDIHLPKTTITEFQDWNKVLKNLLKKNKKVYLAQKEFTENASHEMQTPLAVFGAQIDLLMQTTPLSFIQAEHICSLQQASAKLTRLNRALLLLAKIENGQFPAKEQVNLFRLINKLEEEYSAEINNKQIKLAFNVEENITMEANQELLQIMFRNLFVNAVRHSQFDSVVQVYNRDKAIFFINTATGGPLDEDKLFTRFQKQNTSPNSLGLGLSIAVKIAKLYYCTIAYSYTEKQHCFAFQY